MGAAASVPPADVVDDVATKGKEKKYFLVKNHIDILKASWPEVEAVGAEKVGEDTFLILFEKAPETLRMFRFCDEKDWRSGHHFKHHCKVFVNVIGSSIKSLDNADLLSGRLEFLGFVHHMREITGMFADG